MTGGGIIDLLNKRLRDRLKEIEILNIFTDVCEVSVVNLVWTAYSSRIRLLLLCTHSDNPSCTEISRWAHSATLYIIRLIHTLSRLKMSFPNRSISPQPHSDLPHSYLNYVTLAPRLSLLTGRLRQSLKLTRLLWI